jgi:hypothetical protein
MRTEYEQRREKTKQIQDGQQDNRRRNAVTA